MFTSPTDQRNLGWKDRGHTFSELVVESDGSCVAAERVGGRQLDHKGLLVRYPNPFEGERPPEVLYETKKGPLNAVVGGDGVWWAVSAKELHTNATGKWKASKPSIEGYYMLSGIHRVGDQLWLRDSSQFYRLLDLDGKWEVLPVDPEWGSAADLAGLAVDDVYLSFSFAFAHYDGKTVTRVPNAPQLNHLAVAGDEVLSGAGIGNLTRGFRPPIPGESHAGSMIPALGGFALVDSKNVSLYRDGKGGPIMEATGWIANAVAGNAKVLWIANGIELLCTDGVSWRTVERAYHDRTRGT